MSKAKKRTSSPAKAKKTATKPRPREPKRKAKRAKPSASSARTKKRRAVRAVPAKPSKKKRLTRKPAIVSAKKPKRSPLKVAPKPSKASPKPRGHKKPSRTTAKVGRPSPRAPAKSITEKRPGFSKSPAAIRARKRRADTRAQREQLLAEARGLAPVQGGDERRLAWGWLEMIRDRITSDAFGVDMEITELGGGHATLEGDDARKAQSSPWMIVGRYTPRRTLTYAMLAHGLQVAADDILIEASVHPQRLSQARVEFHDPNDIRREGDTVLSKIGPWEFILTDLVYELVGASYEDPAEGSLASRYAQTVVPRFYLFFSPQVISHKSVTPWVAQLKNR